MQEKNNQNIIKILIAIIISLSMIILFSGVFYILNMQNKIVKLEQKQKEQLKQQTETSLPTTEVFQSQNEIEEQPQQETDNKTVSQKSKKNSSKKQTKEIINKNQEEIDNQEIEKIIDNTINKMEQQGVSSSKTQKKDDDKLSKEIENILK